MVEAAGVELFDQLIPHKLLILQSAQMAKMAAMSRSWYIFGTKVSRHFFISARMSEPGMHPLQDTLWHTYSPISAFMQSLFRAPPDYTRLISKHALDRALAERPHLRDLRNRVMPLARKASRILRREVIFAGRSYRLTRRMRRLPIYCMSRH